MTLRFVNQRSSSAPYLHADLVFLVKLLFSEATRGKQAPALVALLPTKHHNSLLLSLAGIEKLDRAKAILESKAGLGSMFLIQSLVLLTYTLLSHFLWILVIPPKLERRADDFELWP
jgi:hypothetical protein